MINIFLQSLYHFIYSSDLWTILTAIGTISAVIVAIILPFFLRNREKTDQKEKIKVNLPLEIYLNYYSIYFGGLMEVHIDFDQYNVYKSNSNFFSINNIKTYSEQIRQIYNLFFLYEDQWKKETPKYSHLMFEYKFRIKIEILKFQELLFPEDLQIREILTSYLLGELTQEQIKSKYNLSDNDNILEFLNINEPKVKEERHPTPRNNFIRVVGIDDNSKITVRLFEEYIDHKYNKSLFNLKELLITKFQDLK